MIFSVCDVACACSTDFQSVCILVSEEGLAEDMERIFVMSDLDTTLLSGRVASTTTTISDLEAILLHPNGKIVQKLIVLCPICYEFHLFGRKSAHNELI